MLNYVTRVFVGKASGAVNTGTDLATIASSDLMLVNADTNAVIATAADAAAAKAVYVLQGTERAGYPLISQKIVRSKVVAFTEQVSEAKQEQIDSVDFSSLTAGKTVRLSVIFKDSLRLIANKQTVRRVDHVAATTGFSITAEVDKIVSKVNKDRVLSTYVVASRSGNNLVLTGLPIFSKSVFDKYTFTSFDTLASEVNTAGSFGEGTAYPVTNTQPAKGGQGLGVQVQEAERVAQGKLGQTDFRNFDRSMAPLFSSASTNYDQYHITHTLESQGDNQDLTVHPLQTSVYVMTNSNQGNAFQALLEAFVSGLATGAPTGE